MTHSGRVLLIANNFPPVRGGSASVYENIARCAGGDVIVLAPSVSYADGLPVIGWREHDRQAPYRIVRLPLLRTTIGAGTASGLAATLPGRLAFRLAFLLWDVLIRLRLAWTLLRLVVGERVRTVCVGELLASGWLLHMLRLVPGVRTVAYVHGEEITTRDGRDVGNRRGRRALLCSDAVVVVSRFTQRAVDALLGSDARGRTALIENGVDTRRFRLGDRPRDLAALYGLDGGGFVFVSVCRLVEKKGVDMAIRAFAQVHRAHPGSRYLVVGTGPHEAALHALAAAEGVADAVVFAGQVSDDELVEHYRLGDAFVMPNRAMPDGDTEGFGLVFLEANGCGLPVIAGRDGGSPDAVRHGVNGLVVDGRSVDEIAAAMLALLGDGALREALRQRALETASKAGWEERTRAFLRTCAAPTPARAGRRGPGRRGPDWGGPGGMLAGIARGFGGARRRPVAAPG
jgi:phosphatidylinositol alpha-1,6-mannosyltransferase